MPAICDIIVKSRGPAGRSYHRNRFNDPYDAVKYIQDTYSVLVKDKRHWLFINGKNVVRSVGIEGRNKYVVTCRFSQFLNDESDETTRRLRAPLWLK